MNTPPVRVGPPAAVRIRRTTTRHWVLLGLVLAAFGFLLFQGLGNATVYFRTADQATAQRESLGTRRFRIEGVVLAGSVRSVGEAVEFTIEANGVGVNVRHVGDPPELFAPNRPVVLEGRFAAGPAMRFDSDRIMVKHTNVYCQKNDTRCDPGTEDR